MAIKDMRWEFGSVVPAELYKNFSENEKKWYSDYCSNLAGLMSHLNDKRGLDLTRYKKPPKRLYVQVRMINKLATTSTVLCCPGSLFSRLRQLRARRRHECGVNKGQRRKLWHCVFNGMTLISIKFAFVSFRFVSSAALFATVAM